MSIFGCGIDVINNSRILKIISENRLERFGQKIFSELEYKMHLYMNSDYFKIASRFAAKEAFAKAMGTGIGGLYAFKEIEILSDELGKPYIKLLGNSEKNFLNAINYKHHKIFCSMSHEKEYSVAQVIVEVY